MSNFTKLLKQASSGVSQDDAAYFAFGHFNESNSSTAGLYLFEYEEATNTITQADAATTALSPGYTSTYYRHAKFTPNGNFLLTGLYSPPYVAVYDHTTRGTLTLVSQTIDSVAADQAHKFDVSPDGNYIIQSQSGGLYYKRNILWTINSSGILSKSADFGTGGTAAGVRFSPDGNYIGVTSYNDRQLQILDHTTAGSLSLHSSFTFGSYPGIQDIAWSPDGNYICVADIYNVDSDYFHIFSFSTSTGLSRTDTFSESNYSTYSVDFHSSGNYIAVGNSGGVVLLSHSSGTVSKLQFISTPTSSDIVRWKGDLLLVASGGSKDIIVFELSGNSLSEVASYNHFSNGRFIDWMPEQS